MPQSKNKRGPEMPFPPNNPDHQYTSRISVEEIEPELRDLGTDSVSLNEDSARCDDCFDSARKFGPQNYFVSKEWHGPYIEAVCGTDMVKREAIIAKAEQAIVGRFLELSVSAVETDELLDLQSAAYAISELKKASAVVYTPQHNIA